MRLEEVPIIGILRGCPPQHAVAMADAAIRAGIRVLEVTLDSPDALAQIEQIAGREGVVVGAGTVRTSEDVDRAAGAGAQFIVSPIVVKDVVVACRRHELPVYPGAATPTEIAFAMELGAAGVKVFPAEQLGGPAFLRAVAAPLGRPPLVPTGGVSARNARGYLDAGAVALGAGGSLFPAAAMAVGDVAAVADLAREFVEAIG